MPSSDQITGGLILSFSIVSFAYYTIWALVLVSLYY
ncbi:hypothetical protein EON65_14850 [archaeon]|nr:MAG: hypothetical protein EON65_14850 [archaeon]